MSTELKFRGYAVESEKTWDEFKVIDFKPKTFGDDDVEIKISCCGVCGSDVHTITSGWGKTMYPIIPGHEIVGKVTRVGKNVTQFKQGDRAGVGAQVFACGQCRPCNSGDENYCQGHNGVYPADTYNAKYPNGDIAVGGYSTGIRAHQQFVFAIPDELEDEIAAPMLCGGLTVYAPLKRHGCKPGAKVGVVGIGGLGHFAILFAAAMGAEVTAFSHSDSKKADATKMGATHFVVTDHEGEWAKPLKGKFDVIISTRNDTNIPLDLFLSTLYVHGKLVAVGLPEKPWPQIAPFAFLQSCFLGGSHIGNKTEAEEMLKLAAEKKIRSWIDVKPMSEAQAAVRAIQDGSVRYRTVLTVDI
ncbi:hypothetical protein PLICRDRAFT_172621 [Plicaturopsis crispa FD-325 SS-3]|nr:hypothetical protein PLICRDRAFT_172621 [Plicaturopsis crispa FD-325 SS-3]